MNGLVEKVVVAAGSGMQENEMKSAIKSRREGRNWMGKGGCKEIAKVGH